MNRLADEAMYFGAVADGVESQQEEIAALRQQLAESENLRQGVEFGMDCANAESVRLRQQLAEAQAEVLEQARIVGMGGEREIDLRQKLDIVSSLLREAAGRMSYGHWSTLFRARVETALKTKAPKP